MKQHIKNNQGVAYSVSALVVLIGVLYVLNGLMAGSKQPVNTDKMVALTPIAAESSATVTDPLKMYLGMKTWTWVKAKDGDHRDLHSFPTRRSSDLPPRSEERRVGKECRSRW